jgi:hypothetical protein
VPRERVLSEFLTLQSTGEMVTFVDSAGTRNIGEIALTTLATRITLVTLVTIVAHDVDAGDWGTVELVTLILVTL